MSAVEWELKAFALTTQVNEEMTEHAVEEAWSQQVACGAGLVG